MGHPHFTVIVPAYRSAATIMTTLRSLTSQTFGDWEALVVDDGSPDDTGKLIEDYAGEDPRVRLLRQPNSGPAAARNLALAASRGDLISFLDADDAWMPGYLERARDALAGEPGAGIGFADAWPFIDSSKRVYRRTALEDYPPVATRLTPDGLLEALVVINFITTSSVTITRRALETAGSFEETLAGSEDWDLWIRIAESGFGAVRIGSEPLVLLRDRPTSLSKDEAMMTGHATAVLERALSRLPAGDVRAPALRARAAAMQDEADDAAAPGILRRIWWMPAMAPARRLRRRSRVGPPPAAAAQALRDLGEI
ncbi:MAG: glycosyltransferase family A protein [Solirubrobacterales bacterium]